MSNSNNVHRRTFPPSKSIKLQRPVLARGQSSPKLQSLGKKRTTEVETTSESASEDDMTFLQYCPTCDKQIIVPNSSILYCSESCRRKDGSYRSADIPFETTPISSPDTSAGPRTIVPRRTPSTLETFSLKPPVLHDFKADLDPTEWKPDSPTRATPLVDEPEIRPQHHRAHSAAHTFLSQFHGSSSASFLIELGGRRPAILSRSSTSAVPLSRTAPEPSTTIPTPVMSAGNSTSSAESAFLHTPGRDRPVTLAAAGMKSVDLVKPVFQCQIVDANNGAGKQDEIGLGLGLGLGAMEMEYGKKAIVNAEETVVAGSLGKLLGGQSIVA